MHITLCVCLYLHRGPATQRTGSCLRGQSSTRRPTGISGAQLSPAAPFPCSSVGPLLPQAQIPAGHPVPLPGSPQTTRCGSPHSGSVTSEVAGGWAISGVWIPHHRWIGNMGSLCSPRHPSRQLTVPAETAVVPGTAHGAGGGINVQEGTVLVAALPCGSKGWDGWDNAHPSQTWWKVLKDGLDGKNKGAPGAPRLGREISGLGWVPVAFLPTDRRWHQALAGGQTRGTWVLEWERLAGVPVPIPHLPNLE